MRYFKTPKYSIAFIPKSGCSTLARAVIYSFQPDQEDLVQGGAYPQGKGPDSSQWQWLADVEIGASLPVLAFIRNPVERFLSAMIQMGQEDVESTIYSIENRSELMRKNGKSFRPHINPHFLPQILWVTPTAKLYRFPDHLDEGAVEVGFQLPLPVINAARRPKPVPSQSQIDRILEYYHEDMSLYQSISQPGIVTGMVAQRNYEIPTRFGQSMMDGFTGQP